MTHLPKNRCHAHVLAALVFTAGASGAFAPAPVQARQPEWRVEWAEYVGRELAKELAAACPMADPSDQKAFEDCQAVVFASPFIKDNMRSHVLWGGVKPDLRIEEQPLTQFNKDVWRGMYLPLFMFTGKMTTEVNQETDRMKVHMEARFRDTLKPGQYPYPFWHAEEKWVAYLKSTELVFTLDLIDAEVIGIQRSPLGEANGSLPATTSPPPRKFNKDEWMWRDENGELQPKVTLFDGLYHPENPYLEPMEAAYRDFALEMRNNTCFVCHVPNNPEKMQHLLLLQTPAHAAGEIDRVIRSVKAGAMPGKSWAGPKSIKDPAARKKFLAVAEAFKAQVDAAKEWENANATVR